MKQFKGEIAGKKLSDFSLNKLENVATLNKRMEMVKELIYEDGKVHDFFTQYFNEYYDVSPSQSGYLSEDTSVNKILEIIGTYLLSAKDVVSERKIEYRFWKSERDFKKSMESDNVNTSSLQKNVASNVEVIDMFVDKKNDKNMKVVKDIAVNRKDIKEIEEIKNLEDAIQYLKSPKGIKEMKEHTQKLIDMGIGTDEERTRLKYIAGNTERYIKLYVTSLRDSQLIIKKAIKRPIEFKNTLKDEGVPNKLDALDFMESKDVCVLLPYLYQDEMMSDMGMIIYDLNVLINSTQLSSRELEIVNMFRNEYKQTEIAEELGIRKQNVKTYMKRIADKVSKTYEKQVESYRNGMRQKKVN